MIQRRNSVQTLVPDIVEKFRGINFSDLFNRAPKPPLNILVIPPSNPPSNVDKVTGFNDKTDAKWDDMSGTATSAEICRLNALQSDGKYVAWGYRGEGNDGYSNSCFLYKNFPPGFEGNDPGFGKMESGCLNPGELVKLGCKKPVPIDCTLTPSDSPFSPCSTNECGVTGIRSRKKYRIASPSMYGGTCVDENLMDEIDCENSPCSVDCVLTPTPSDSPFSPCSTNECGVTGIRSRKKYRIASPSMYGGTCVDENLMESTNCVVSSENCLNKQTSNKNVFYFIGAGVLVVVIILILFFVMKKNKN